MRFSHQQPLEKAKHPADILQNQMGDTGQTDGTYQQHQHREGNPVLPAAGDKRHQRQDAKERCAQPDNGTRQRSDEALKARDQMEWVRRMNSIQNRAEEILLNELVYA